MKVIGAHWGWVLAKGALLAVLGAMAFAAPFATSLGIAVVVGGLLLAAGLIQLVNAYQLYRRVGRGARIFNSLISIIAGGLVLRYPGGGMLGVAMMLSFYFFLSSVFHWGVAKMVRPQQGWGWEMVNAVTSFLLGVLILATFPFSALWIPGLLLGINLVVIGSSMIGLAMVARRHLYDRTANRQAPDDPPMSQAS